MNRNTEHGRRGGRLDRRVVLSTLAVATVAVGVVLIPQSSNAAPRDQQRVAQRRPAQSSTAATPAVDPTAADPTVDPAPGDPATGDPATGGGQAVDPAANGSGAAADPQAETVPAQGTDPADSATPSVVVNPTSSEQPVGQQPADGKTAPAPNVILGNTCEGKSELPAHDGFQLGGRCVSTEFGEVANADQNPSLLITSAPRIIRADRPFDLRVSTRNLVRDRFLAAGAGGYYKESSFLNDAGLVRGHFHTACRTLTSRRSAPDPAPVPAFFAATEDGAGGATPDTVTVRIPGLPRGEAQCAVWAGDGSHRVPMMQRANQIPAFDVVRISVR